VPRVEVTHDKLYSDEGDDPTQIWYAVWRKAKTQSGTRGSWQLIDEFGIAPKESGDCELDYSYWMYLNEGEQVQWWVYSDVVSEGDEIYDCSTDERIDPSCGTPSKTSAVLGPIESYEPEFDYAIETK
jgi:hypothetical protein